MKKFDVIAMGELLIDFTTNGESEQGNTMFEACPGGAPCNVLAMLERLGHPTAFIGKVGADRFGRVLRNTLTEIGIDASRLFIDEKVNTTLAFVHTLADGDREFSFYRRPGADMMLTESEIEVDFLRTAGLFHFGTLSMTHETNRKATVRALQIAKENGLLISFDPNLREPLWDSLAAAKEQMEAGFRYCDILKISDNEIQFVTGKEDYDEGIREIQERFGIPLIVLTMGKNGSRAYCHGTRTEAAGFPQDKTVDTTGAGDTFCGCILHFVLRYGVEQLSPERIREMLTFANAAAALITTKKGAIRSMPTRAEIDKLIEESIK